MPNLIRLFEYWKHYGTWATLGHSYELLVINPRRFCGKRLGRPLPSPKASNAAVSIDAMSNAAAPEDTVAHPKSIGETVCFLTHYFYPTKSGGTERFIYNLAGQVIGAGCRALVITLGNERLNRYPFSFGEMIYRTYRYDGLEVVEVRHRKAPLGLYYKQIRPDDAEMARFAGFILREKGVGIVHAAYPQPFASFLRECLRLNIPYIVTATDFALFCHYSTMITRAGEFCTGSRCGESCAKRCPTYGVRDFKARYSAALTLLENAAAVTAPSLFVKQLIENEFRGICVQVIAHGIDQSFVNAGKRSRTKRFLYAGTLSRLKGLHILLDAFGRLPGDFTLEIYGSGDKNYEAELHRRADKRVTFHGAVSGSDMHGIYADADCVVVPSMWYETYNFVIHEALLCGCIVIVSNVGAMPEVVAEGANGFTFSAGNIGELVRALRKAVDFDWSLYQPSAFSSLRDESGRYLSLYGQALPAGAGG